MLQRPKLFSGVLAALVACSLIFGTGVASAAEISSAGPLTSITVSPDLNCAVNHASDSAPEFYGGTACATLIASNGTLYGPAGIPAGESAAPRTTFAPVSQTAQEGSGTAADPLRVTTVVDASELLHVTETDSYQVGTEYYRTDVNVQNASDSPREVTIYRAGDCYLQNSDNGFGRVDQAAAGSAVACRGIQVDADGAPILDENGQPLPGDRIEQWVPLTSGSHYYEAGYSEVWAHIGSQQPFPDTCLCDEYIDNGAGLSWTMTIPAGGNVTVSHLTAFSPTGDSPIDGDCIEDGLTLLAGTGVASGIVHSAVEPLILGVSADLATSVHDLNCSTVVPLEDQIDALLVPAG